MEAPWTEAMPGDSTNDMFTNVDEVSTDIISTNQSDVFGDCPPMFGRRQFPAGSGIDNLASTLSTTTVPETIGAGVLSVFSLLVCAVGLFGNVTVIVIVLTRQELKKGITVWYILQLAIADMLFLSTIPFQYLEDKYSRWTLSESSCKFKQSIMFINFYSSISFLTVMALDRYIAVCQSLTEASQKLRSRKAAYITTVVVWIACISASTPAMTNSAVDRPRSQCMLFPRGTTEETCAEQNLLTFDCCMQLLVIAEETKFGSPPMSDVDEYEDSTTSNEYSNDFIQDGCSYHGFRQGFKVMIVSNFVVFLVACFVLVACYALIMRHLWTNAFHVKSTNNTRNRNRVTYMCIALVLIFIACWLPYHAQHLAKLQGITGQSSAFCEDLNYVTSLLVYVNSAINPFIYFFIARLKTHIKSLKSSRAASFMSTLFARKETGDRTPITRRSTRLENEKNDVRYCKGKSAIEMQSNLCNSPTKISKQTETLT